jgi:hypothetical protein
MGGYKKRRSDQSSRSIVQASFDDETGVSSSRDVLHAPAASAAIFDSENPSITQVWTPTTLADLSLGEDLIDAQDAPDDESLLIGIGMFSLSTVFEAS